MKRIQVYLKQAYRKSWSALTFSEMIMELNSVLVPDEEIAQIHDFARILKEAKAERDAEQARTQEILDRLRDSVNELRESSTRAAADWHSLEAHQSIMKQMEDEKFDLAKKINEQEAALSVLETEIEDLRKESDAVENWDIEQELFRGMGFLPFEDGSDSNAQITSLLVHSKRRNVAVSIDIDEHTIKQRNFTQFDLAEQLWAAVD